MNCYIHPELEATGTCVGCGKFIGAECTTTISDKNYCPQCVAKGVPYQTSTSTNALAIISLIFGIVSIPTAFCYGCGIIFAIVAIITGLIARSQIKQSGGRQGGDGLALAGLIIGALVAALAIIGVLCYGVFMAIVLVTSSASGNSFLIGPWNLLLMI
jgi:Domain of unknown function (DUF4190)